MPGPATLQIFSSPNGGPIAEMDGRDAASHGHNRAATRNILAHQACGRNRKNIGQFETNLGNRNRAEKHGYRRRAPSGGHIDVGNAGDTERERAWNGHGGTASTVPVPFGRSGGGLVKSRFSIRKVAGLNPEAVIELTPTPSASGVSVIVTGPAETEIGPEHAPTGTLNGNKLSVLVVTWKVKSPVTGFVGVEDALQTSIETAPGGWYAARGRFGHGAEFRFLIRADVPASEREIAGGETVIHIRPGGGEIEIRLVAYSAPESLTGGQLVIYEGFAKQ